MNPSLALIGCGAIAQNFYLPSLAELRGSLGALWFVDPISRNRSAAASMISGRECSQMAEIDGPIDLAIVATPNSLHFPLAADALRAGAHVLLEKPFVLSPADGQALIALANEMHRVLAVNQTRRFFPFAEELRSHIRRGDLGRLKWIEHQEGVKLAWPFESGAAFAPSTQRTGVIMDFGVHALDFYQFLLEPEWSFVSAVHDGFEGPEGLAEIDLMASGTPVSLRLSRYCQQENMSHMSFEHAEVSFNVHGASGYTVHWHDEKKEQRPRKEQGHPPATLADRVLLNFMAASQRSAAPVCAAHSTLPVIEILDEIYCKACTYQASAGYV